MSEDQIRYDILVNEAFRGVIRAVLQRVQKKGLPGDHHFFITFDTSAPGAIVSKRLKEQYPEDMTIVLQNRFWDLMVYDDRFEVKLSFNTVPERLIVPFAAIRGFADPSVPFALNPSVSIGAPRTAPQPVAAEIEQDQQGERPAFPRPAVKATPAAEIEIEVEVEEVATPQTAEVVKLDLFRKK